MAFFLIFTFEFYNFMMFSSELIFFCLFSVFVVGILIFDLTVVGRKSHVISFKESLIWTSVWVTCALLFYFFISMHGEKIHGIHDFKKLYEIQSQYAQHLKLDPSNLAKSISIYRDNMATEFITGYLIEYTLSVDNIFVIMLIFSMFSVNSKYHKRVLFWGILGAIVLRFLFIFTGSALIQRFEWILLLFGAFLIFSGGKMFFERNKEETIEPQDHWLVKFLSKHFSVFQRYVGGSFFIKRNKKVMMTPLFVVLILVEFTDLVFAFDSIPAIFAVTRDPYIVFFSNIFAIIGLRSLFFLLVKVMDLFHYLKVGVSCLLAFVGLKLVFHEWLDEMGFKTIYSLYVILGILAISILASLAFPRKGENSPA
jgi:tellurite resistance protein TerC